MSSISPSQTIVLITGANQGLGFVTIKKLAAEQTDYALLLASRDFSKGAKAAESITKLAANTTVVPVQLEVTSDDSIAKAVDFVASTYGKLDVLFNNAGILQASLPTLREQWLKVLEVNAVSAFLVTEAFIPLLKKAGVPRVVFMSSGLGSITESLDPAYRFYGLDTGAYSVSKTAMNMVGAQMAVKYKEDGLKVNMVCPGQHATSMNGYVGNKNIEEGAIEAARLITEGKDGRYSTFSEKEGPLGW